MRNVFIASSASFTIVVKHKCAARTLSNISVKILIPVNNSFLFHYQLTKKVVKKPAMVEGFSGIADE